MPLIYQTYDLGEADFKAYVTHHPGEADAWIYLAGNRGFAGKECIWYITKSKGKSRKKIYFGNRGIANLIIYFVKDIGSAGWRKTHRLQGKIF